MITRQLLTASAIALLVAAAPLGLGSPAFAKGAGHAAAGHAHAASGGHASAGGHHGGSSKGGRSSDGGGHSGGNGLDTARSIMSLVGGFLPH